MADTNPTSFLPSLDDMLQSLLLIEEGEHEFTGEEGVQELRHLFFPVTRNCIYLDHAASTPLLPCDTQLYLFGSRRQRATASTNGSHHAYLYRRYQ